MRLFGADAQLVKLGGAALFVLGILLGTYMMVADEEGLPRRYWGRYVAFLGRKLRRLFMWTPPEQIAQAQVAAIFMVIALAILVDLPFWWAWILLIAIGPAVWLERKRQQRVTAIEAQTDGFMLALANALKSTPSLGDAFKSVQAIVADPLRQDIDLAVKEMRVGSTLEQAILLMAGRIGSRQFDSALSAVLIGRQVGGNLPKILDTTASSIREMSRLEGVVRTKTAEGKMQLWVLAAFPFLLVLAINSVSPGYFDPLTASFVGYVIVIVATIFWVASLVLARKILAVDV